MSYKINYRNAVLLSIIVHLFFVTVVEAAVIFGKAFDPSSHQPFITIKVTREKSVMDKTVVPREMVAPKKINLKQKPAEIPQKSKNSFRAEKSNKFLLFWGISAGFCLRF